MRNKIGTFGIISITVGFVIGASVFIIPGQLAGIAGPSVILAYLIAGALGFLVCLATAQLGTAVPVEGGGFILISRLLSPFFGFVTFWLTILASAVGTALLAFGFADYLQVLWPESNRLAIALGAISLFGIINLLGAKFVVRFQSLMVAWLLLALVAFSFGGITNLESSHFAPLMPNGVGSVFHAATLAYFSFSGFIFLLEIGGDIASPRRTIPRGLTIGFLIVLFVYISVCVALIGLAPPNELAAQSAPVAYAAALAFPAWFVAFLTTAALVAAATSINGVILAYPRDILAMGEIRILPETFAKVSPRTGEPTAAILLFTAIALIAACFSASLAEYATVMVFIIMVQQVMLGLSLLRLPFALKGAYQRSGFKLNPFLLVLVSLALIAFSLFFIYIMAENEQRAVKVTLIMMAIGAMVFILRSLQLKLGGVSLSKNIQRLVQERIADLED